MMKLREGGVGVLDVALVELLVELGHGRGDEGPRFAPGSAHLALPWVPWALEDVLHVDAGNNVEVEGVDELDLVELLGVGLPFCALDVDVAERDLDELGLAPRISYIIISYSIIPRVR